MARHLAVGARVDEFDRHFAGRHLWRSLLRVLWREVALLVAVGLAGAAAGVAVPWSLRQLFERFVQPRADLAPTAAGVTTLLVCTVALGWYRSWREQRAKLMIQQMLQRALFSRLQIADPSMLRKGVREPLTYLTTYTMQLTNVIYLVDFVITSAAIVALSALAVIWLGVLSIAVLAVVVGVAVALRRMIVVIGQLYFCYIDADHERVNVLRIVVSSLRTLRRQHLQSTVVKRLSTIRGGQFDILSRRARAQTTNRVMEDQATAVVALAVVGFMLLTSKAATAASIFPLLIVVNSLLAAVDNNLANYRVLRLAVEPAAEIEELFRLPTGRQPGGDANLVPGELELRDTSGVAHRIGRGRRLVVVAHSPSDASAYLRRLVGAPQAGPAAAQAGHAGVAAFVGRGQPLFDGPLAEIAILWSRPVDHHAYRSALIASGLADDLRETADADGRALSSKDAGLSEGQAQRLSLAQALYAPHDVLVLDDVFAPLNPALAEEVASRILDGPADSRPTVVYSTSRLELLRYADAVALLGEDGELSSVAAGDQATGPSGVADFLGESAAAPLRHAVLGSPADGSIGGATSDGALRYQFPATAPDPAAMAFDTTPTEQIRILDFARNSRGLFTPAALTWVIVAMIVAGSSGVAFASILDDWPVQITSASGLATTLAVIVAIGTAASAVQYAVAFHAPIRATLSMHERLIDRLLASQGSEWQRSAAVGRLTSDFVDLEMQAPQQMITLTSGVVLVLLSLAVVAAAAPVAGLVVVPFLVAAAALVRHDRMLVVEAAQVRAAVRGPVLNFVPPALGAIGYRASPVIRLALRQRFTYLADISLAGGYRAIKLSARVALRIEVLGASLVLCVIWGAVASLAFGWPTVPALVVFVAISLGTQLTTIITSIQGANSLLTMFDRISDLLGQQTLPPVGHGARAARKVASSPSGTADRLVADSGKSPLRIDGATVVLADGRIVFEGVSLQVRPGELVALVGASGVGKSTLAGAIVGEQELRAGSISVAGADPRDDPTVLHRHVVHLDSDIPPLPVSVRDFVDPEAACGDLAVRDLIVDLSGLAAPDLDQSMAELSHSTRQLCNLARGLIRHPGLLVLDEATSALDTERERHVWRHIRDQLNGAGCLVIAHRPDNLDCVDRVLQFSETMRAREQVC